MADLKKNQLEHQNDETDFSTISFYETEMRKRKNNTSNNSQDIFKYKFDGSKINNKLSEFIVTYSSKSHNKRLSNRSNLTKQSALN